LFWQFVVGLLGSFRYDGEEINPSLAKLEAEILHEAIKNKKGKLDDVIRILTTRSKTQLKATFNRYRDDHGYSLSKVIGLNAFLTSNTVIVQFWSPIFH
jgi:hypothetical protein